MNTPETQSGGSLKPVGSELRWVAFKCVACGLKGKVSDPTPMESVSCPECNARYLHHPDGKWFCVVRPYFAPNVPAQRPPAKDVLCDEMDCREAEQPDFTMDDLEWSEAYE